jgi:hypothetical protein
VYTLCQTHPDDREATPSSCVLCGGPCLAPPLANCASTCSRHPRTSRKRTNAHPCPPAHLAWPKKKPRAYELVIPCASRRIVPTRRVPTFTPQTCFFCSARSGARTRSALRCVCGLAPPEVTTSWPWVHGLFAVHMRRGKRRQKDQRSKIL